MLSTYLGIKRFDNKAKEVIDASCPATVVRYNQALGYVDENNKLIKI